MLVQDISRKSSEHLAQGMHWDACLFKRFLCLLHGLLTGSLYECLTIFRYEKGSIRQTTYGQLFLWALTDDLFVLQPMRGPLVFFGRPGVGHLCNICISWYVLSRAHDTHFITHCIYIYTVNITYCITRYRTCVI